MKRPPNGAPVAKLAKSSDAGSEERAEDFASSATGRVLKRTRTFAQWLGTACLAFSVADTRAQESQNAEDVFALYREDVDASVDKALRFLAKQQAKEGWFPGQYGQTSGLSSLVGMAFLAKGYLPGEHPYGVVLNRCIDRVLSMRKEDGLLANESIHGHMYSHCLSCLFLSEVSGMVDPDRQRKIHGALKSGIRLILDAQRIKKPEGHQGGWRYTPKAKDSDLSVSGWALMALRSARLNGAPVPAKSIDDAIEYVAEKYDKANRMFGYTSSKYGRPSLTGVAILCLELTGHHGHPVSKDAAAAVLTATENRPMAHKNAINGYQIYGDYYLAQAMFQLGGDYWKRFAKWMYSTYLPLQRENGSWGQRVRGNRSSELITGIYETSLLVLALSVPYRQLPIYQREE